MKLDDALALAERALSLTEVPLAQSLAHSPKLVRAAAAGDLSEHDGGLQPPHAGSLITDDEGWAVGLLFAGDDVATYANHIPSVLDALDVDFL